MNKKETVTVFNLRQLHTILLNGHKVHAFGGRIYLKRNSCEMLNPGFLQKMVLLKCMIEYKTHHYKLTAHGIGQVLLAYPRLKSKMHIIMQGVTTAY